MKEVSISNNELVFNHYFKINQLILNKKNIVQSSINREMVELYFEVGKILYELIEQNDMKTSQNEIIKVFSEKLTNEYGKGFLESNLKKMKKFYMINMTGSTLWNQLSWS